MASRTGKLGVGVVGIGWCASQHIRAFNRNPHTEVVLLCSDAVQQTWDKHLQDRVPRVTVIKAPGVGPQSLSRKTKQDELRKAVERAKRLVG